MLKRILIMSIAFVSSLMSLFGAQTPKGPEITRVEPPFWWVGMANDTLQIMVTGPGIASAQVSVDYPGVKLSRAMSLDSPNYKLLYLTIAPTTRPGNVPIVFSQGKRTTTVDYELKPRDRRGEDYGGFDASDVLYLLMPDRFAKGQTPENPASKTLNNPSADDRQNPNARHGGNLQGIADHLDYLDSLGVTAVWLTPVLENDMPGGSYHGYATTDYYRVDPRFGTNEQYAQFIRQAQDKGLKVVMDMIFNHTGTGHPWLSDLPSNDWYNYSPAQTSTPELTNFRLTTLHDPYVSDYDLDHTVNGWFVTAMPDLNQRNPHVMKYLTQNSIWWIEQMKINGIRMDTYPYADMRGMSQWAADVLKEYPNFNIVGECWYANEAGSAFWQKGNRLNPVETNLPTVMDFFLTTNGHRAFDAQTDPWSGLNVLYDHLAQDFLFPDPQKILTFLDNHDTDRFLLEEITDTAKLGPWKQAQTFLLTSRGIPQIYYGTELLMNGSKEGSDGFVRRDFPGGFPGDTENAFTPEGRTPAQQEAWNYLSKLLKWRRGEANEVIARGSLKHFMPQNGIYAYQRRLGDKAVTVLMNGKDTANTVTMDRTVEALPYGSEWTDMLTGQPLTIPQVRTFAPREVLILQNF